MGAVYEARHNGTGRRVAVKLIAGEALAKSADIVSRFQREAMATGAIESQYIAHVTDTGVDPSSGSPYMVMELLVGEDVEQAVKRLGPLPPDVALRVGAQACLGLQRAHEAGVIHRDIKPANLYLTRRDGGEVLVKLLDFGIAKMKAEQFNQAEGKSLTRTGTMLGSPLYMSPEQALGKKTIDHRTDLWSLGVVLYEALTGVTPHGDAETVGELLVRICSHPPRVVQEHAPWVTPDVAAIVHRALALDPAARFATAAEMYGAIKALLPAGHALDEAMFVSLSPEAKRMLAPRMALPGDVRAPAPSSTDLSRFTASPAVSGTAVVSTTAGLSSAGADGSVPAGLREKSRLPLVLAAAATLVGIGLGALGLASRSGAPAPPVALVAPPPPMPAPSPPLEAKPDLLPSRTVRLVVLPVTARVEVDGARATVANGAVDLSGSLGSAHRVRLVSGGREKTVDVVIAETGASPPMVDLGPPKEPPPRAAKAVAVAPPPATAESKKNPLQMEMK
jgi:serine/threonine-protein kinase